MSKTAGQGLTNVILLYCFGIATALYPPIAQFAQPLMIVSFFFIFLSLLYGTAFLQRPIPTSILHVIVCIYLLVYVVWLFIASVYENDTKYILLDSSGFIIYLLTPVIFVFVSINNLSQHLCRLLINLCIFIAVVTLSAFLFYYVMFGKVSYESLLTMNSFLKSYKLNWELGSSSGLLRADTYTGHFFLFGVGLSFYYYYISRKHRFIFLIFLFTLGLFADGHRALVVSLFILLLLLFPLICKALPIRSLAFYSFFTLFIIFVLTINYQDDFELFINRFAFSGDDPSISARMAQIPALYDKIAERPLLGSGFGSFASVIRSEERPFSYEVDLLATVMKLGILGSLLYFGVYLYMLNVARRAGGVFGYILFCIGISYLFYMVTNGNTAMSSESAIFQMFLFILISLSISRTRDAVTEQGNVRFC